MQVASRSTARRQVAGAELGFVQQMPSRDSDELAGGSHAGGRVRQRLGKDSRSLKPCCSN